MNICVRILCFTGIDFAFVSIPGSKSFFTVDMYILCLFANDVYPNHKDITPLSVILMQQFY